MPTRPPHVGQPVLLLTHSTDTGWQVYAALIMDFEFVRPGLARLLFIDYDSRSVPRPRTEWFKHRNTRGDRLSFWVHLDERHLIEMETTGEPWEDDIADQLDRLLEPKEPRL